MYSKQEYLKKIDECIANGVYKDDWDSLAKHETANSVSLYIGEFTAYRHL